MATTTLPVIPPEIQNAVSGLREILNRPEKRLNLRNQSYLLHDIHTAPVIPGLPSIPYKFILEYRDENQQLVPNGLEALNLLHKILDDLPEFHAIRPYIYSINVVDPRYWQDRALAEEED